MSDIVWTRGLHMSYPPLPAYSRGVASAPLRSHPYFPAFPFIGLRLACWPSRNRRRVFLGGEPYRRQCLRGENREDRLRP